MEVLTLRSKLFSMRNLSYLRIPIFSCGEMALQFFAASRQRFLEMRHQNHIDGKGKNPFLKFELGRYYFILVV